MSNNNIDIDSIVNEINNEFEDDVEAEAREEAEELAVYNVPEDSIFGTVVSRLESDFERDFDSEEVSNPEVSVAELEDMDEDEWVDFDGFVEVVDLWEDIPDWMSQSGLVSDGNEVTKFTTPEDAGVPELEEGNAYEMERLVVEEYQGHSNIKLTSATEVREVEEEVNTEEDNSVEFTASLIGYTGKSGLIKRCSEPDCSRVLENGECPEHGEVEGEFDMRIMGVMSGEDLDEDVEIVAGQEVVEEVTGMSLQEAKDKAMDALDTSVVLNEVKSETLGRYFHIEGDVLGDRVVVHEMEPVSDESDPGAEAEAEAAA